MHMYIQQWVCTEARNELPMTLYNAGQWVHYFVSVPHRKLFNSFLSAYHLATKMCLFREEVPSTCHDSTPSCPLLSLQQTESAYNSQVRVICSELKAIVPNGYYILLHVLSGKACLYIYHSLYIHCSPYLYTLEHL